MKGGLRIRGRVAREKRQASRVTEEKEKGQQQKMWQGCSGR
jgi:hypothetical protein